MAYVEVPQDLTKIKTKVALNLTKRQLICFSVAALIGVPFYLLTKGILGTDVAAILMVILMLPMFVLAMYEKDGLPAEKILRNFVRQKFICPQVRVYQTENFFAQIQGLVDKEGGLHEEIQKTAAGRSTRHCQKNKPAAKKEGQQKTHQRGKEKGNRSKKKKQEK